jgi:diaminopimelate decarboxylase
MSEIESVEDNPFYRNDGLIRELVGKYHSPLYVFDENSIRRKCHEIKRAVPYERLRIRYACKALSLQAILQIVLTEGLWIDASSINEVHRALMAGFAPSTIYYTGEGATLSVYEDLTARDVLVNCTSIDQIHLLGRAGGTHCSIRINPGEGHGANTKTNTGGPSSKHGIYYDQLAKAKLAARQYGIKIVGVHSHIGSGTDVNHWLRIKDKTLELAREFDDLQTINLGGGLPVVYDKNHDKPMLLQEWGEALTESMQEFSKQFGREVDLQIEPGRYIVAESGALLAEAQAVKCTTASDGSTAYNFIIVNTGLNHNIRPALYGSYHPIRFISSQNEARADSVDYVVAGYLCESGDVFTVDDKGTLMPRRMKEVRVGDIMVMAGVGAYVHSLKSEYNSMNLPASVLIDAQGRPRLVERRGTLQDIMRRELDVGV